MSELSRSACDAALEHDAARLHDVAVLRHRQRHDGVLLDQQHGQLLLRNQPLHDAEDLLDQHRRQAERGLVEQHDLGLRHQRAADRQHLLLAAGEVARELVAPLLEQRKVGIDALDAARDLARLALHVAAGDQVLLGGQVLEHAPALEHLGDADARHVEGAHAVDALVAEA